jgi:hypothetical protein
LRILYINIPLLLEKVAGKMIRSNNILHAGNRSIGCDLTVTNAKGETPLDVARRENRTEDVGAVLIG